MGVDPNVALGGVTGGRRGGRPKAFPPIGAGGSGVADGCAGGEGVDVNGAGKSTEPDFCGAADVSGVVLWLGKAEDWLGAPNIGPPKTDFGALPNVGPPKTEDVDANALADPRPPNADCIGAAAEVKEAKADLTWLSVVEVLAGWVGAGGVAKFDDSHSVALRVTGCEVSGLRA